LQTVAGSTVQCKMISYSNTQVHGDGIIVIKS